MKKKNTSIQDEHIDFMDDTSSALLLNTPKNARLLLWVVLLFFIVAVVWASFAKIDKVTVATGKVIPSGQLQMIQNLEGGLVQQILVQEGQHVKKGQKLLLINDTQFVSDYQSKESQLAGLQANSIGTKALLKSVSIDKTQKGTQWQNSVVIRNNTPSFTPKFQKNYPQLVTQQQSSYNDQINNLENQLSVVSQQIEQKRQSVLEAQSNASSLSGSLAIAQKEYNMTAPLAKEGVVPPIQLLKLERQLNTTKQQLNSARLQIPLLRSAIQESILQRIDIARKFRTAMQTQLNTLSVKIASLSESQVVLKDRVKRTVVISPVNGIIQRIFVNTIGGVIQPGMNIVSIVPSGQHLMIQARLAPQDIAFMHPGLQATIKFSAYNFSNYGGLLGQVKTISADTIQDKKGGSYYQVLIQTDQYSLNGPNDQKLPIIPGMTATVDIITGRRSVLNYLLNPVLKARHTAFRE
jgi:adhesin transport system membrane fusion protein